MTMQIMFIGQAIAPVVGGAVSHSFSWRLMQVILGIGSFTAFLSVCFLLPETIHPGLAGYEKAALGDNKPGTRRRRIVLLNPLKSLMMLRSPVLLITVGESDSHLRLDHLHPCFQTSVGAISLITDLYLLVPLSYVFVRHSSA